MLGPAHSASGAAAFTVCAATIPIVASHFGGDTVTNGVVLAVGAVTASAFALVPDFDTRGKAVNSLGIIGIALMYVFQTLSSLATLIRTQHDTIDGTHRTFTHTIPFALLMFGAMTLMPTSGNTPLIVLALCVNIALAGVFAYAFKRLEKGSPAGVYGVMAFSLALSATFAYLVPPSALSAAVAVMPVAAVIGILAHMAGDIITRSGIPLLFPIPIKGRLWHKVRIGGFISASDPVANGILYFGSIFVVAALSPSLIWLSF